MALLELLSKPEEEPASMKTLDLAARLANGDEALPLLLQASSFFIEKGVGVQRFTVVDNSDISPSRLTFPLEAPYSSYSEGN